MGNDVFYLGVIMRLCRSSWFCGLILIFFSNISLSAPHCWSFSTIPKGGGSSNNLKSGQNEIKTSCKLSGGGSNYHVCGDLGKPRNRTITESDETGITIHYQFVNPNYFDDGFNFADEQFNFGSGMSSAMSGTMAKSLISALNSDNCGIAQQILDSLQKPNIKKDAEGNSYLSFGEDGDTCVVKDNGQSQCEWHSVEKDEDGRPRITLEPNKNGSLNDYAKSKERDKPDSGNAGESGKQQGGSGGVNEHRGNSSSSGGSSSSHNSSGGNNDTGAGDGNKNSDKKDDSGGSGGSGLGKGDGDGKGDDDGKNGKGKLPELQEFNIDDSLFNLKTKLSEMVNISSCNISGQCPSINVSLFGASHHIDIHCRVFEDNGEKIKSAFTFLWTLLGILIILSA